MGLSLAIASLVLSQTGSTVSYAADAVTVGDLVKALAKQANARLDVTATLASEPVIVQFKDRPLDEVQSRLADLIGAVWIDQGGVPTLSRPTSLQTDQEREERRRQADLITRALDSRLRKFETAGAFDRAQADKLVDRYRLAEMRNEDFMAEHSRMEADNPIVRTGVKILRSVDPIRLVQMRMGGRIVFSDVPTAVQSPLSAKGKEAIAALRKDLILMEEAKKALGNPKKPFMNVVGHPSAGPGKSSDPYGKTILVVQRYGPIDFRFELTQVVKDGRRLLGGSGALTSLRSLYTMVLPKQGTPLDTSADARAFGQLEVRGGGVRSASSRSVVVGGKTIWASFWVPFEESDNDDPAGIVRPKLIDPVRYDPLGIVLGQLLRQMATRRGQPLMATLGDDGLKRIARTLGGEGIETEEALLAALTQSMAEESDRIPLATVADKGEWIDVRPLFPVYSRRIRFSRRAVRDALAEIRREGALTFAMARQYNRRVSRGGLDYLYFSNGDPGVGPSEVEGVFNASTPFLSSLTPTQWDRLEEDPQSAAELSADQKETVRRWIYEELADQFHRRLERSSVNPLAMGNLPLTYEPTELFPNGVPGTLRLKLERTDTPIALVQSTQGLRFALDAPSFGLLEGMQTLPAKHPEAARRSLAFYRPANRSNYLLKLHFAPDDALDLNAWETRPTPGTKFGPRSALPEALLKEADRVQEAFLKSPHPGQ